MNTASQAMTLHRSHETVSREQLVTKAAMLLTGGWRLALVAGHDDADDAKNLRVVYVFLSPGNQCTELTVLVPRDDPWVPTLAPVSYPGSRFDRQLYDLFGINAMGHPQPHQLVLHSHWPREWHPLRRDAGPLPTLYPDLPDAAYPFIQVEGEGVYEIPVGPIHAGLIEPGHFRFSVVGETILQLTARLWFMHRGVEKLFIGRDTASGLDLAERISGDTAIGHSLAYAMAVENAAGIDVDDTTRNIRALLLEMERMYNHVNDIGAIVNDVAYGIINAHGGRLREKLLRVNKMMTGHRLLRGAISIGGAALRHEAELDVVRSVAKETQELVDISLEHSIVAERMTATSVLSTDRANRLGTLGYVARASGIGADARVDFPSVKLPGNFRVVTQQDGDIRARLLIRAGEVQVSADLITELAARLQDHHGYGDHAGEGRPVSHHLKGVSGSGVGVVEAWRGAVVHRVELAGDGTTSRVAVVDPSFFNWTALPHSLEGTIVPDFPLTNKSYNQSYAGNDL